MEDHHKEHPAGELVDLAGSEAIAKIQELAKGKVCHFGTYKGASDLDSRPMYTHDVDEAGAVWFMSKRESKKDEQLRANQLVDLLYLNQGDDKYLHLKGRATEVKDQAIIDKYWSEFIKTWFPEGKDDPSIVMIKVVPFDVYYWDTQHGKVVSLLKIAYSTVTGATKDDGREGHLKL